MWIISEYRDIFIWFITVVITLFVPIAILFLTNLKEKHVYKILDQEIISHEMIDIKWILVIIVFYFIIIFLWSVFIFNTFIELIFLLLLVWLSYFLLLNLVRIYMWHSPKYRDKIRADYLSKTIDFKVWGSVFRYKDTDLNNWTLIMDAFFKSFNNLENIEDWYEHLNLYYITDRPNLYNIIFFHSKYSSFQKFLDLYHKVYLKYGNEQDFIRDSFGIRNLIQLTIWKELIHDNTIIIYKLSMHIKKYNASDEYKSVLLYDFLKLVLKNKKLLGPDFLDYLVENFPSYKITKDIEKLSLNHRTLLNWIREKIIRTSDYNSYIDNVIDYLIPNISPMMLSDLLYFLCYPNPEDYVKIEQVFWARLISIVCNGRFNSEIAAMDQKVTDDNTIDLLTKVYVRNKGHVSKHISLCDDFLSKKNISIDHKNTIEQLKSYLEMLLKKL